MSWFGFSIPFCSRSSQDIKYHGLWNQGATCYLNSVLQVLFMTKDFREAVERHTCQTPGAGCVECDLKTLFEDLKKDKAKTNKITRSLGIDDVHEWRDAAECFRKILTQISPEASQIFNGQLTHKTTCCRCGNIIDKGSFCHLSLSLEDSRGKTYNVVEGTEKFFEVSHMSGENQLFCDHCKAGVDATVKYEVKHPEVLMLQLKRFEYRHSKISKNDRAVNVPYTLQIPEDHTYELYAVVEHSGCFTSGSYSAKIKSQDDERWYNFNNVTVTPIFTQPFQKTDTERFGDAYLLFYRKKKTHTSASAETIDTREESTNQGLVPVTTDNDDQCQGEKKTSKRKQREETVQERKHKKKEIETGDVVNVEPRGVGASSEHMYKGENCDSKTLGNVSNITRDEGHKQNKHLQTVSVDKKRDKKKTGLDVNDKGQKTGDSKSLDKLKNRRGNQRDDQQLFDSRTSQDIKYHGLLNQGATCYLNSVLQVLFMTKDFREAVERSHCAKGNTERSLKALFAALKKHTAHTRDITKSLGINNVFEQSDAAEWFEKILTQISPEASQIFNGQLTHKTTCFQCCTDTYEEGSFWHLSLPLVASGHKTFDVVKGTEKFFEVERMSGENQLFCDNCDAKADATVKCEIKHHPEVLMLLLKRFHFDYRYMTYVKNYRSVDVPYSLQIPEDQTYELYAVVDHYGELRNGHYTVTIKSQDDKRWYRFNDNTVRPLSYHLFQLDHSERCEDAYLLFYRKKKTHTAASAETKDIREESTNQGLVTVTTDNDDQCQGAKKTSERKEDEETVEKSKDRKKETGTRDILNEESRGAGVSLEDMYKGENCDSKTLGNVSNITRDEGHKQNKHLQTTSMEKDRDKKKTELDVNKKGQKTGANKSLEELKNVRVGDSKQKMSGNHEVYKQTDRNRLTERNERHREEKRDVKREQDHCQTTKVNQRDDQQSFDSHTSQDIKYHSLLNHRSTCYLNSVLQVLFMTKDFREAVERHTCQTSGAGCVECDLKTLFEDLKKDKAKTNKITKSLGINNVSEQSDAAECFKKILTQISPEASQIFNGQLTHKTTCCQCCTDTEKDILSWHLSLPLKDSPFQTYSVVKGAEKFFKTKGENQLFCDHCAAKADATVKYEVNRHPEVLMLELKRFKFHTVLKKYVKNYCAVDVPYTLQIPEHQTYELFAVVEHFGELTSGHYTVTIKSQDNEKWYYFNNDTVSEIDSQPFEFADKKKFGGAYLLFYRKKKTHTAASAETKDTREESTNQGLVPVTTDNDDQCQGAKKISERKEDEETVGGVRGRNKETGMRDMDNGKARHITRDEGHKRDKDLQTMNVDTKGDEEKTELDINNKEQKTGDNKSLDKLKNRKVGDSNQKMTENNEVYKLTDRNKLTERNEHHREEKRDVKREQDHCQTTKVNQRDDQQSFDSHTFQDIKYHGLLNQKSTCYLNSVLQVLFMTKDFREAVERHTCQTPGAGCVECDLKTLFEDLKKDKAKTNKITKSLGINNVSEQSDAAECFKKILTQISPEASQIFNGQLTHKTTCCQCCTDTEKDILSWHLSLPLKDSSYQTYSVVKGAEEFFKASGIKGENQLFCDHCAAKADATVKYEIKHHPEVLMLELKRFHFDYRYKTYVRNDCLVDVPYTLQIPEDQTYELYAVVEHSGTLRSGYYTVTIKSQENEKWYRVIDDIVVELDLLPFQRTDTEMFLGADLLFYRKKKTHTAATAESKDTREESTNQGLVPVTTDNVDQCQGAEKISEREETVEEGKNTAEAVSMKREKETVTRDVVSDGFSGVGLSPEQMYKAEDCNNENLDNFSHITRDEGSKQKLTENDQVHKQTDRNRLTERNERHREEKRDVKREQDHCQTTKVNQRDDQQSFDSHTSQDIQYHGLLNQGSTCYLNSVLQVLFMTKDFREAVERHTCQTPGAGCVECDLKTLFEDLKKDKAKTNKITKNLGIDNVSEQSDAAECFKKILTQISPEASQIFNGQLTHKTTCSRCRTDTYEGSFWHLSLPLVDSRVETYSVVKGTEKFFKVSHMSGENQLFCDDCDAKADAAVKYEVKHHPEVLMLLLKRFNFDYRYMTYVKNYRSVDVPYSLQIPEDQTYELYAVVEHSGSFRDGHYSATIKSQDDETWYKFNNDTVTPVFFQPFKFADTEMLGDAYLLFYRKKKTTAETKKITEMSTDQNVVPVTDSVRDVEDDRGQKTGANTNLTKHDPQYEQHREEMRDVKGEQEKKENQRAESVANIREESRHSKLREGNRCDSKLSQKNKMTTEREVLKNQIHHHLAQKHTSPPTVGGISQDGSQRRCVKINIKETSDTNTDEVENLSKCLSSLSLNESEIL